MHSLARLRLRLTAWYVGVFLSILALLGGGLFLAIRHRMSQQLDASLRAAASALMQAARIREAELVGAKGVVADAVDELHIPDRALYLFAAGATPIKPAEAPDWIREAAREAERAGAAHRDLERGTTSSGCTPNASAARTVACTWPRRWATARSPRMNTH